MSRILATDTELELLVLESPERGGALMSYEVPDNAAKLGLPALPALPEGSLSPKQRSANSFAYLLAVLVMVGMGVGSVIGVTLLRPGQDNTLLVAAVFGFLAPTTMALLAFMKSQETHSAVNGRLDTLLKAVALMGSYEGIAAERDRVAAIATALAKTVGEAVAAGAVAAVAGASVVAADGEDKAALTEPRNKSKNGNGAQMKPRRRKKR